MDLHSMIGKTFDLYGADAGFFCIADESGEGIRVYEAVEDMCDGYRSSLAELRDVTDPEELAKLVFSRVPIAKATGRQAESTSTYSVDDVVELVDADGHVWLRVGTTNTDDYYPCYEFTWSPKAP